MSSEIAGFLQRFHIGDVDTVFTCGCCYWFSLVLCLRFQGRSRMMYDQVENHFATEVDGRLYDITGDVTGKYNVEPWDEIDDDLLKRRIVRDCIMF